MIEGPATFEVWYLDQVNEGREVWAIHDDWCETIDVARDIAKEKARTSEYRRTRIVRVERQTVENITEE